MNHVRRDRLSPVVERIGGAAIRSWSVKVRGETLGIVTRITADGTPPAYRVTYWALGRSVTCPTPFLGEWGNVDAVAFIMDHATLAEQVGTAEIEHDDDAAMLLGAIARGEVEFPRERD